MIPWIESRIVWPAECRVSAYLVVGLPIEDIRRGTGSDCGRIKAMRVEGRRVERARKLEMMLGNKCL